MASAKDAFEAVTFGAGSFACGTWRGIGVELSIVSGPYWVKAQQGFAPGMRLGDAYIPGQQRGQANVPGSGKGQSA
jgi:hypothetical protein